MSGICGIVRLDGAPASTVELDAILQPLKQRGPDGARARAEGPVALGHALLATTPEALEEKLPLRHAESGCTITADVRLDNRGDLLRDLGLPPARPIGDGELILMAYLKWQEACVDHLLGDFAFAIWDARRQRLFCARDHMGMRQLTYCHQPGRAFVFATEPRAVLAHADVPKTLNQGRIADFLDRLEAQSLSETFYASISRLPPAHSLTVDDRGLSLTNYWRLTMPPPLSLPSDEDYAAAFLDVFGVAVDARLRCAGGVGAMLSGGLDSGAAAAVAAERLGQRGEGPLPTFSVVGPDPASCRETCAIHASSGMPGIAPHLICYADVAEYRDDLRRLIEHQSDPFDCYMGMIRTVYLAAHKAGLKVMLDGVASDLLFSATANVGRLLRGGRVLAGWREAQGEGRYWDSRAEGWKALSRAAWAAWTPSPVRSARRRLAWWSKDRAIGKDGLISRDFAEATKLRERRRRIRDRDADRDYLGKEARGYSVSQPYLVVGRERYDRIAAAVGIEPRDPFIDLRVIRFCLSLPREQLQSRGWPKIILRRAMAGKLPDQVRWRRGRDHLGGTFTNRFFSEWDDLSTDEELKAVLGWAIDSARLSGKPLNLAGPQDCQARIEAICLCRWLKSHRGEFEPQY